MGHEFGCPFLQISAFKLHPLINRKIVKVLCFSGTRHEYAGHHVSVRVFIYIYLYIYHQSSYISCSFVATDSLNHKINFVLFVSKAYPKIMIQLFEYLNTFF